MRVSTLASMCLVLSVGFLGLVPHTAIAGCIQAPAGLVSWWPGDGSAEDIFGTNDGTLRNGATFATGLVGQAFSLDGSDDFIEVPNSASLGITGGITIEAWVNLDHPGGPFFPQHYVVDSRDGIGGGYGLNVDTELIQFWIGNFFPDYPSTIQVGQWHHVAGTYDGSHMTVYVDGVVMGSFATVRNFVPSTSPLFIGQRFTFDERFDGLIDEVEIHNRALIKAEIEAVVNAGGDGKCKIIPVEIDIKPGSDPNFINLRSRGSVPVAILSTSDFDAATVDPSTLTLADAPAKLKKDGTPIAAFEDIDGDGLLDLVVHFSTEDLQLTEADAEATLEGTTFDGSPIQGTDSVLVKTP